MVRSRTPNPDLAALAAMVAALLAELVARAAQDASLLALLPDWAVPAVVAMAAAIRWRVTRCPGALVPSVAPASPEDPGAPDQPELPSRTPTVED